VTSYKEDISAKESKSNGTPTLVETPRILTTKDPCTTETLS